MEPLLSNNFKQIAAVRNLDQFYTTMYLYSQWKSIGNVQLYSILSIIETVGFVLCILFWGHINWETVMQCAPHCTWNQIQMPFHFATLFFAALFAAFFIIQCVQFCHSWNHYRNAQHLISNTNLQHQPWPDLVKQLTKNTAITSLLSFEPSETEIAAMINRWDDFTAAIILTNPSLQAVRPCVLLNVDLTHSGLSILVIQCLLKYPFLTRHIGKIVLCALVTSPFVLLYRAIRACIEFADKLHNRSVATWNRTFSVRAIYDYWLWNELPQARSERHHLALVFANECLQSKPIPFVMLVTKGVSFFLSMVLLTLVVLAIVMPSNVMMTLIGNQTLWWWTGLLGGIVALLRQDIPIFSELRYESFCCAVRHVDAPLYKHLDLKRMNLLFPTLFRHCLGECIATFTSLYILWKHAESILQTIRDVQANQYTQPCGSVLFDQFEPLGRSRQIISCISFQQLNNPADHSCSSYFHCSDYSEFVPHDQGWSDIRKTIFETRVDFCLESILKTTNWVEQLRSNYLKSIF